MKNYSQRLTTVAVRRGNHPLKAVLGIPEPTGHIIFGVGHPVVITILERPIIIFRFSDHFRARQEGFEPPTA